MSNKGSVIFYIDEYRLVNNFSDEEFGKLYKAVFEYAINRTPPTLSEKLLVAFSFISQHMERDMKKYEEIVEKRRAAGKRSGEVRANTPASEPSENLAQNGNNCASPNCVTPANKATPKNDTTTNNNTPVDNNASSNNNKPVNNDIASNNNTPINNDIASNNNTHINNDISLNHIPHTNNNASSNNNTTVNNSISQNSDTPIHKDASLNDSTPIKKTKSDTVVDNNADLNACFEEFWGLYPKRLNKESARKEYLKLKPDSELRKKIISSLKRDKVSENWTKERGKYIPLCSNWIINRRWEDVPDDEYFSSFDTDEFFAAALKKSNMI